MERRGWKKRQISSGNMEFFEALESRVLLTGAAGWDVLAAHTRRAGHAAHLSVAGSGAGASGAVNAPSGLTAMAQTASIALKWTDRSTNESGFRIYRSTDGVNFSLLASLGKNKTTYSDSAVSANTTYSYYVQAYNSTSSSVASNTATATIFAQAPSAPSAPTGLNTTSVADTSITLSWTDTSIDETGIHVFRSTDGVNYSLIAALAAGSNSYTDTGLSASTAYSYEVSAWNSAGETYSSPLNATTDAAAASPPPSSNGGPISLSTVSLIGYNELRIDGTTGNDSINISQSNGVLIIAANGQMMGLANTYGAIDIYGVSGQDTITVDSSVNIAATIYAGDGSDTIKDQTTGKATIVTVGSGTSNVTGNGINTAYWVNPGDTVNATSAETALNGVNRVSQFYQPWTTNSSNPDYVSRELYGQNLRDPSDIGSTVRLTSNPFYGLGVSMNDINQGSRADCYIMADLASLAYSEPQKLMNQIVDFGDGTYGFKFVRAGVTSYVRVDGDLPAGGWSYGVAYAYPGADGNQWVSLYEKAYAFYRSGANTFTSLDNGNQNVAFNDLGFQSSGVSAGAGATSIMNTINSQLNAGHAVSANTNSGITGGAPLIGSHVYTLIGAYINTSGVVMIQLRNPWGFDGAGNDGNPNDGLVTIPYDQFSANFGTLSYSTV